MTQQDIDGLGRSATFGRRKVTPRVCVADSKHHIRLFLREALEELGFITCECAQVSDLAPLLDAALPDIIVLGLSAGAVEAGEILRTLTARHFGGKVLLLGPRDSSLVSAVRELGQAQGVAMLPPLETPFTIERLRECLTRFLPMDAPMCPPVDASEAVRAGWLELWYQPKIGTRNLALQEVEGLVRVRHPTWGVVLPACFVADDDDPHSRVLSKFVVGRAIDDWHRFVTQRAPVAISVNLPIAFLRDPEVVETLCTQMPDHPAFEGLIVELNGADVVHNLDLVREVAMRLRFHNIAISIDDVGAEWPSLVGHDHFPFVELKVDRTFITGCADDRLKRAVCRQILDVAEGYGARSVAEGVETRADFLAVRDMGFDLAQGFLFAKPMAAKKFARTMLGRPVAAPH
jgi:EAL domain-containing protein (putative c-di-GMP-specific phosphodiesterase class I)